MRLGLPLKAWAGEVVTTPPLRLFMRGKQLNALIMLKFFIPVQMYLRHIAQNKLLGPSGGKNSSTTN